MNFDELDKQMRVYEESLDQVLLPELYLVARLDGNRFTRLTKEVCQFEAPFDERFRNMMVHTVRALMDYGFRVIYGFTESDEISLLFHPAENTFGRKVRKYNSILGVLPARPSPWSWDRARCLTAAWCRCPRWNGCGTTSSGGRRTRTATP